MNIRHERPMPDMAFRMKAPLGLTLRDGTRVRIDDWSMRGIKAHDIFDKDFQQGVLAIPFQGVVLSFPVQLEPTDEPDFYEFRNMNGRQRETLALFYRNLLSGKMASTADMITSLDTPVDLVPMEETEAERDARAGGAGARKRKAALSLALYVVLFLLVFGYLGSLAWTRLNTISLAQPRFVAPTEVLNAPKPAFVKEIVVPAGRQVAMGDVLVRLSDPEAEAALDEIRFEIDGAERALAQIVARIEDHKRGRPAARRTFERTLRDAIAERSPFDFTSGRDLGRVRQAQRDLANFDLGLSFAPRDFNDQLAQFRALEEERRQVLRQLRRERGNFKDAMDALVIAAPAAGAVTEYAVQEDQYLRIGSELLTFEADAPRVARGWLDDRLAGSVYLGMPATIRFNQGGERVTYPARVSMLEAGMNPAAPDRFGMIVTVEAIGMDRAETRRVFPVNAPVEVLLDRQFLAGLRSDG